MAVACQFLSGITLSSAIQLARRTPAVGAANTTTP
jgi:hypothetical protein